MATSNAVRQAVAIEQLRAQATEMALLRQLVAAQADTINACKALMTLATAKGGASGDPS